MMKGYLKIENNGAILLLVKNLLSSGPFSIFRELFNGWVDKTEGTIK